VEQNELSKDIYRILDELPEVYRSVLTLIDVNDLDYTEAAQALKVPIGTVKSRLARARLQMKNKLRDVCQIPANFARANAACAI
jgi:RNA polymerase sigma-70 factor (ECF subfamily)